MIKNIGLQQPNTVGPSEGVKSSQLGKADGDVFKGLLDQKLTDAVKPEVASNAAEALKFSSHAIERIQSRGIKLDPADMKKLNDAVEKALQKGSKETLVIMGESAFVVSAKNKTVITAMDKSMMKENVFTNIDSTILV
jgi:flagellar operon protein